MATIVVLNDGTTYSDIEGTMLVWIDESIADEDLEPRLKRLGKEQAYGNMEVLTVFRSQ